MITIGVLYRRRTELLAESQLRDQIWHSAEDQIPCLCHKLQLAVGLHGSPVLTARWAGL